jgi:hypothetical protein
MDHNNATQVAIDTSIANAMEISNEKLLRDIGNRLKKAIDWKHPNHGAISTIANETGINRATLSAIYTGRNLPNNETIAVITNRWKEYALWIMTGKTIPEAGQTSPELEQLEELRKRVGTDE